jgi:UDP-N-acetylglucosamine 2-epimerase (non-hydrolysing)
MTILGTRPEAIKMAPVIRLLERERAVRPIVVSTGQHREMLQQILSPFGIWPNVDLGIMRERQSLNQIVRAATLGLEDLLAKDRPDLVVVQGDTTTAFVGALAAFHGMVPVAHVEAGLRTHDKANPYPEEVNRRLISVIAELHFAPTSWSGENLRREGIAPDRILVTGNTGIDCLLEALRIKTHSLPLFVPAECLRGWRMLLVTAHRRENWDRGLAELCVALRDLVRLYPDVVVLFPVHVNPAVRQAVFPLLGASDKILLVDPLPYWAFIEAMEQSQIILTDSGGVQEEAPSLGKPVLVVREKTERPEGVVGGAAQVVGTTHDGIVAAVRRLLDDPVEYVRRSRRQNPYGDGLAARRVVDGILHFFGRGVAPEPFTHNPEDQSGHVPATSAA